MVPGLAAFWEECVNVYGEEKTSLSLPLTVPGACNYWLWPSVSPAPGLP